MIINRNKYEKHIVLLVDLLGFSNKIKDDNIDEINNIIDFLSRAKGWDSNYKVEMDKKIPYIQPNISAFSDLILISFPWDGNLLSQKWSSFRIFLDVIVQKAIELGLLVRGAITIDELYHKDEVSSREISLLAVNLDFFILNLFFNCYYKEIFPLYVVQFSGSRPLVIGYRLILAKLHLEFINIQLSMIAHVRE